MGKYIDPEQLNNESVSDIRKLMDEINAVLDNVSDEELKSKSSLDLLVIYDFAKQLHEEVMGKLKTW